MNRVTDLADRLRTILKERGVRAKDFVVLCAAVHKDTDPHISQASLSQYMTGARHPNAERVGFLSRVLNVNEYYLLGYDVPSSRDAVFGFSKDNNHSNEHEHILLLGLLRGTHWIIQHDIQGQTYTCRLKNWPHEKAFIISEEMMNYKLDMIMMLMDRIIRDPRDLVSGSV